MSRNPHDCHNVHLVMCFDVHYYWQILMTRVWDDTLIKKNSYLFSAIADGSITIDELNFLLKTGGRTKLMKQQPLTKFRPLLKLLDKDNSGGLSQQELWYPIKSIIEMEGDKSESSAFRDLHLTLHGSFLARIAGENDGSANCLKELLLIHIPFCNIVATTLL